ncbi:ATP-binding cassette domain-containing protein [Thermoactinospora rubra]|uniref:ATP-binding cassette domain-containing protein n=1 Tax=Thermoactinospora rubra TaxID=1088767 RepID=UPI000A1070E9|nr:ATP-binding cassette domain-containing protein [Thermoactinospora rubra]
MSPAILAEGLVKKYGDVVALDGVDLAVPEGTVFALLGPNGAGKTTTVRILTTLLRPDAGRATVAGFDVVAEADRLRARIGASGQYAAVDDHLTGAENLEMVGRLYHLGVRRSKQRARELLERFDLTEAADRPVRGYSGGMRRRLDLAGALVADPPVLFLDEPTTGLDPRARASLWDVVAELVAGGTTVLLTTQYLEEADRLAQTIAVVDHGRVIALGTADELKGQVGGDRVELTLSRPEDVDVARRALAPVAAGETRADAATLRLTIPVSTGTAALTSALGLLAAERVAVRDAVLRRPTLDEVFLTLTGHQAGEPAKSAKSKEYSR